MNIQFRRMILDDVPEVYRLEQLIFRDSWSRESFITEVENKEYAFPCVLLLGKKIIAYAVVWHFSGELHINNIAVAPDYRGQEFGKKLLEYLLEKFNDCKIAFLEVRISNQAAINLYRQYSFKEVALRKGYYRDGEDAIVMMRENKVRGKYGLV